MDTEDLSEDVQELLRHRDDRHAVTSHKEPLAVRWEEVFVTWIQHQLCSRRKMDRVHQRPLCGVLDGQQGRPWLGQIFPFRTKRSGGKDGAWRSSLFWRHMGWNGNSQEVSGSHEGIFLKRELKKRKEALVLSAGEWDTEDLDEDVQEGAFPLQRRRDR